MAYSASGLSFSLENLKKIVIITGEMIMHMFWFMDGLKKNFLKYYIYSLGMFFIFSVLSLLLIHIIPLFL